VCLLLFTLEGKLPILSVKKPEEEDTECWHKYKSIIHILRDNYNKLVRQKLLSYKFIMCSSNYAELDGFQLTQWCIHQGGVIFYFMHKYLKMNTVLKIFWYNLFNIKQLLYRKVLTLVYNILDPCFSRNL